MSETILKYKCLYCSWKLEMPARRSVQAEKEWRVHFAATEHDGVSVEDGTIYGFKKRKAFTQLYNGSKLKEGAIKC